MVTGVNCLHIGLHKTASTYLQKVGFPTHPEIRLLPFRLGKNIVTEFLRDSWNPGHRPVWCRDFQQMASESSGNGSVNVISEENLSGGMMNGCNSYNLLHHIKANFQSPRIIIVLREQFSYLLSAWLHHVREGGVVSARAFLERKASPAGPILYYGKISIFDKICYDQFIGELFQTFGRDNVKVVLYESMKVDFDEFISDLYKFIGTDASFRPPNQQVFPAGESVTPGSSGFIRFMNRLTSSDHVEPVFTLPFLTSFSKPRRRILRWAYRYLPTGKADMRSLTSEDTIEKIRASNRKLAALTDLDLAGSGYLL
jgi:hypothetical protein